MSHADDTHMHAACRHIREEAREPQPKAPRYLLGENGQLTKLHSQCEDSLSHALVVLQDETRALYIRQMDRLLDALHALAQRAETGGVTGGALDQARALVKEMRP